MTIFRCRVLGPGPEGDIWSTGIHASGTASIAQVYTAWATLVNDFVTNTIGPMWSTETQATSLIVDQLDPVTGKNTAQVAGATTAKGTGEGNQLPQRVAVVIGTRTSLPTRAGRGRMYWPGLDDTHYTTTGLINTADCATLATGMGTVLNTFSGVCQAVILHRALMTTTAITSVSVGQVAGTQRRRTNKVPNNYQGHGA